MKFRIGQEVVSKVYGVGIVIDSGYSRRGGEQYGIRFYGGGPQGWAENANHDVDDLMSFEVKPTAAVN